MAFQGIKTRLNTLSGKVKQSTTNLKNKVIPAKKKSGVAPQVGYTQPSTTPMGPSTTTGVPVQNTKYGMNRGKGFWAPVRDDHYNMS